MVQERDVLSGCLRESIDDPLGDVASDPHTDYKRCGKDCDSCSRGNKPIELEETEYPCKKLVNKKRDGETNYEYRTKIDHTGRC
ncbi:hypothetical protein [Halostagnicola kamekurae]|uniref:hypothetical protein n=1 Tax=Halostagnicola kamekurae TaxID=619731 RepID=UPI0011140C67|nr:hypothetical protein [Halostagnicola kamekurae]